MRRMIGTAMLVLALGGVAPSAAADPPATHVTFTGTYEVAGWCYHEVVTRSAVFRLWERAVFGEPFTSSVFVGMSRTVVSTSSTCDPDATVTFTRE